MLTQPCLRLASSVSFLCVLSGRGTSILVIILGSCHYVWVKSQEQNARPAYAPVVDLEDMEEGRTKVETSGSPTLAAAEHERRD